MSVRHGVILSKKKINALKESDFFYNSFFLFFVKSKFSNSEKEKKNPEGKSKFFDK